MITLEVDVGSLATKAVILKDNEILVFKIITTDTEGKATKAILDGVLAEAGLAFGELQNIVATGIGKREADYARETLAKAKRKAGD